MNVIKQIANRRGALTLMLLAVLLLTSCTVTAPSASEVTAYSLFSEGTFTLLLDNKPHSAPPSNNGSGFSCKLNFEELAEVINKLDNVSGVKVYRLVEPNQKHYISFKVQSESESGIMDEYVIACEGSDDELGFNYTIGCNKALFKYDDYVSNGTAANGVSMLLPVYLVTDTRLTNAAENLPVILDGVEYETQYSIEEFYNFYNGCGWYNVTMENNAIIISGYAVTPVKSENDDIDMEFPIAINFSEHVDQSFVKFSKPAQNNRAV